jgi:hypothetical protein
MRTARGRGKRCEAAVDFDLGADVQPGAVLDTPYDSLILKAIDDGPLGGPHSSGVVPGGGLKVMGVW